MVAQRPKQLNIFDIRIMQIVHTVVPFVMIELTYLFPDHLPAIKTNMQTTRGFEPTLLTMRG